MMILLSFLFIRTFFCLIYSQNFACKITKKKLYAQTFNKNFIKIIEYAWFLLSYRLIYQKFCQQQLLFCNNQFLHAPHAQFIIKKKQRAFFAHCLFQLHPIGYNIASIQPFYTPSGIILGTSSNSMISSILYHTPPISLCHEL